ncbi:hypothetical protein CCR97_11865 [Rhodoplanes elegans]|nr:hypothetical protein [Rhodoplanes elegans]
MIRSSEQMHDVVMAGLVPAIHVLVKARDGLRVTSPQRRAGQNCSVVPGRRASAEPRTHNPCLSWASDAGRMDPGLASLRLAPRDDRLWNAPRPEPVSGSAASS